MNTSNKVLTADKLHKYYRSKCILGENIREATELINSAGYNTEYKLILSPLEKITDEDAIEVCRLTNANVTYLALKFDKKFVQMGYKVSKRKDSSLWNYDVIDFLRSKGYDCDNAISEGWAISSNEKEGI